MYRHWQTQQGTRAVWSLPSRHVQGDREEATEEVTKAPWQRGVVGERNAFQPARVKSQFCCVAWGRLPSCSVPQMTDVQTRIIVVLHRL